jgi:hypothetical protein
VKINNIKVTAEENQGNTIPIQVIPTKRYSIFFCSAYLLIIFTPTKIEMSMNIKLNNPVKNSVKVSSKKIPNKTFFVNNSIIVFAYISISNLSKNQ